MLENSTFNDELTKLQKSLWENVDFKGNKAPPLPLAPLFQQWLIDIDKCWQDHPKVVSEDIDSLYTKLSSSSQFLFKFSEFIISDAQGEAADAFYY